MKTARRITRNFLSLAMSEIVAKILQLVIFIYIARIFGKTEFGEFGFALAFSFIIAIIADFGLNTLLIREISRDKQNVKKYISNALTIKIFLSIVTFLVAFIFLNFMNYSHELMVITYIMVFFVVLQTFTNLFYSVFRAFEKMHFDAALKVLRMVILSLLVFFIIVKNGTIINVVSMFVLTEILILIISFRIFIKNFTGISIEFDSKFCKNLLKKSSFFGLSLMFGMLLLFIDSVMLQNFKGSSEVGIYTAAFNLLLGVTFIPIMFSNAVFPVFSRYFQSSMPLLKFAYKKSFQYMLILGLPISIGIFIYARNIINLIYGVEYNSSIIVIKILSLYVLIMFMAAVSGTILSSINRQGSRVLSQGTVAIINIILNLILIPQLGFIGAGIATVISSVFILILYSYFIIRYNLNFGFIKSSIKPLIGSIIMALIIINIPNLLLGTIVGAVSYFSVLLILRTFKKEDKDLLTRIIKDK